MSWGFGVLGLGYLGGYEPADGTGGVTLLDTESVQGGLTLFTSGHAPVVYLMSLTGQIIHRWQVKFENLWPSKLPFETNVQHRQFIRRAHVFPNGDLLAVFEYIGMVKLDEDSNVIWKNLGQNHHDFAVAADGTIATLVRQRLTADEVATKYPGFSSPHDRVYDDQIVFMDADGNEWNRISVLEAFHRSDYGSLLSQLADFEDVFHANSVDIVEARRGQAGVSGELLISLRNMNAIASVDVAAKRVSWVMSGPWRGQHQAQVLANGNILLLDNLGGNAETPLVVDRSEVLEIDPATQEIVWRYAGSDAQPFFTVWLGYVQRLANGNTLVTESAQGRLFEVAQDGRVVWEYLNPNRAGPGDELIATVMGARRIELAELEFLDPPDSNDSGGAVGAQ